MEPKYHVVQSLSSYIALEIPREWLIRALVLCSMLLQLFLVACGAFRYRNSSFISRPVLWVAYICADSVATSALSIMMHSSQSHVYGIWAPLLLLHLGGPDTITAYSTADNELWLRHGFIMIYQVVVAMYVIYLSSLQGSILAAAILLFIAGATMYAERTMALRSASYTQIVNSTQPIYKFMQYEDEIDKEINKVEYNYLVIGEEQLQHKLELMLKEDQKDSVQKKSWKSLFEGREIVTIKNVWEQEGLQTTDNYILCLSHALFKMYKRRFVNLFFHEGVRPKTRRFFINDRLPSEKVFKIVEMELKFMYDALFSKSSGTAFSKMGIVLRCLSTCLLVVAGFLVFFRLKLKRAQETVTFLLISVAFGVEVIQLCRLVLSDWTMVRLICAYIVLLRRPRRDDWYIFKLIQIAMRVLGKIRKLLGDRYCKKTIMQYSVIDACSTSYPYVWKAAGHFRMLRSFLVPFYIRAFHIAEETVHDDFKRFMFGKLKAKCSPDHDIAICRGRVYGYDEYFLTMKSGAMKEASELDMEDLILTWHIATTICEKHHEGSGSPSKSFSRILSRYCAYLLVSCPNLLPVHADIAKISYIEIHYEILQRIKDGLGWLDDERETTFSQVGVYLGIRVARQLLEEFKEEIWEILAEYWAGLLIYMAVYNKAPLHAECLAGGGEFLSQLWVLLGHMGCGEQSDTAVTKKREENSKKEKEEEEKKRKREEDTSEQVMKNRRNKEEKNWRIQQRRKAMREEEQSRRREKDRTKKLGERLKPAT